MALVSGVMSSLNPETYEAAAIDGASAVQQMRYLTIPSIIAAVAPLLIMSVASNFNNFGMIYFITGGGPANVNYIMAGSTDILITWVFRLTVDHRMYNFASVMSVFIFVIVASVSGYNMWRTRAFRED
jgi:arabinogalactan oligomer/maltooligosaccharide transport system permease protein